MEKKNNNILIIILIILVLGLSVFIVYDKILKDDTKNSVSLENENSDVENQNSATTSNSFEIFKNNLIQERNEKYDSSRGNYIVNSVFDELDSKSYSISLNKDGVLELSIFGENQARKTIANDVLLFTLADVGNGGLKSVYFIKEDGTVSSWPVELYVLNNEDSEVKNNIGNFQNIIAIIPGLISSPVPNSPIEDANIIPSFVDINGNILVLDDNF